MQRLLKPRLAAERLWPRREEEKRGGWRESSINPLLDLCGRHKANFIQAVHLSHKGLTPHTCTDNVAALTDSSILFQVVNSITALWQLKRLIQLWWCDFHSKGKSPYLQPPYFSGGKKLQNWSVREAWCCWQNLDFGLRIIRLSTGSRTTESHCSLCTRYRFGLEFML